MPTSCTRLPLKNFHLSGRKPGASSEPPSACRRMPPTGSKREIQPGGGIAAPLRDASDNREHEPDRLFSRSHHDPAHADLAWPQRHPGPPPSARPRRLQGHAGRWAGCTDGGSIRGDFSAQPTLSSASVAMEIAPTITPTVVVGSGMKSFQKKEKPAEAGHESSTWRRRGSTPPIVFKCNIQPR